MSERLSKGLRIDGSGWVEGLPIRLVYLNSKECWVWGIQEINGTTVFAWPVHEDSIAGYIGLKDTLDHKIFERDILRLPYSERSSNVMKTMKEHNIEYVDFEIIQNDRLGIFIDCMDKREDEDGCPIFVTFKNDECGDFVRYCISAGAEIIGNAYDKSE